jgi:DNA-directed RNA polymerase specialized sigma24 family protein
LPLQLHDIDDAERFVGAIVTRSGLALNFHDAEDLSEYLLVECWQLSLHYQAGGISFSTWAGNTLRRRSVDWIRQRRGRTIWRFGDGRVHERQLPSFVPFDGLDDALGAGSGDPADSGDSDLGRVATTGDRQRARDLWTLGLEAPRRTT